VYSIVNCIGPATGTLLVKAFANNAAVSVNVPFPFLFGGVNYGQLANFGIQVSSNGYITFGGGSIAAAGLGPANPPKKSVHIGATDSSWQRLYHQDLTVTQRRVRILWEGYSGGSALKAANVQWEASFYTNNTLTICVGGNNALANTAFGALSGVSNGAGRWLANYKLALNTLYVVKGLGDYT
jgi:hypothetical protein